jgi:hypothetical protein
MNIAGRAASIKTHARTAVCIRYGHHEQLRLEFESCRIDVVTEDEQPETVGFKETPKQGASNE